MSQVDLKKDGKLSGGAVSGVTSRGTSSSAGSETGEVKEVRKMSPRPRGEDSGSPKKSKLTTKKRIIGWGDKKNTQDRRSGSRFGSRGGSFARPYRKSVKWSGGKPDASYDRSYRGSSAGSTPVVSQKLGSFSQMGTLMVSSIGNNVFLTFSLIYDGHVHQYSSSLRRYETMKGQKMTDHMLTSMMYKFLRELKVKMPFLVNKKLFLNMVFKGSLWIRPPVLKALSVSRAKVLTYSDATGIGHNGVRPKARRRV